MFKISAATNQGLDELIEYLANELKNIPKEDIVTIDDTYEQDEILEQEWNVEKIKEDYYLVTGAPIERLMSKVNVFDIESSQYMQRVLNNMGVMEKLKELGLKDGDVIDILGHQMEYSE